MLQKFLASGARKWKRALGVLVLFAMAAGLIMPTGSGVMAASGTTITSMSYYSTNDGPALTGSGVENASYGFVMPVFNGGAASFSDVAGDLQVNVKADGIWKDIDTVSSFVYNNNWGHWNDSGFSGYWFKVSETTYLQLASKANPGVTLEYTLEFNKLEQTVITSMTPTQGPEIDAGVTGSAGFTYPTFNGNSSIKYEQVAEDLKVSVWSEEQAAWIDINDNAASGWIYDQNFGQFWDGDGGYWFTVDKTTKVRLESKTSPQVYLDYTIKYSEPVRTEYKLSADQSTYTADASGAIGIPLPRIDGTYPVQSELGNFVYEIYKDGAWVNLADYNQSGFIYQGNGYSDVNDKNQWGYWVDGIYGLWFQPIQEDMQLRIGYPTNGQTGGAIGDNYVYYNFVGNPDAPRPDPKNFLPLELGTSDNAQIEGWNYIWGEDFTGNALNTGAWNYATGYYLNSDPNTWGWGNAELEYYTDSEKNVAVKDGALSITAYDEPTTFPEIDPNRTAQYSSGKITSQDKFTFKYGRIDFRAKLPTGQGVWPALWMLPNDDTYGTWAASGELDVMEAKGRYPDNVYGTIHFGGTYPANKNLSNVYTFPEGTDMTDWHVYSVVWEQDMIKWYVDGTCYSAISSDKWYTSANGETSGAPFDQEFYIVMNLAVGGWFDNGVTPLEGDIPANMQVDYVRVYQDPESTNSTYTNNTTEAPVDPVTPVEPETPSSSITNVRGDEVCGLKRTDGTVEFYVNGATFADLHYKVNGGGQVNVGMQSDGNGNYTYAVTGLSTGDTIEYFFTYNPGNGALDSQWETFVLPAESDAGQGGTTTPEVPVAAVNLSAGKQVTVSGVENNDYAAANLVDSNADTRWSSNFADDAWAVIDLGSVCNISEVVLNWEAAYGKKYEIQVSTDGNQYKTAATQENGAGGVEKIALNQVEARYVKIQGIERALPYGYSLYEAEVYGNVKEGSGSTTTDGSTTTGGSTTGTLPTVPTGNGAMTLQLNNKTNGKFSDSEIYWLVVGYHPETGKLCYVDKNGNLVEATTALNTITKGDRKCADIFYTLEEADWVSLPNIVSGRMYLSYGSPVYVTINQDINGNMGFAGPDLNNPSDPNQDVYFEFIEFTLKNGEYWGNTTRVDNFCFPVVTRLFGEGGFDRVPGDSDVYDKTVGDVGTRDEIYSAFASEVPEAFKSLSNQYRIVAPCKGSFNAGQVNGNYFDAYIEEVWNTYRTKDLVFQCEAGEFRGRVVGDDMIFSKDGGASDIVVHKPTTQDVLEGKGTLDSGTSMEKVVEAQLCAALNRGVALNPEHWSDAQYFYQQEPCNYYAKFWHDHSVNGYAYGFCYDDVFDYSTLLHYTNPTGLIIDLKW